GNCRRRLGSGRDIAGRGDVAGNSDVRAGAGSAGRRPAAGIHPPRVPTRARQTHRGRDAKRPLLGNRWRDPRTCRAASSRLGARCRRAADRWRRRSLGIAASGAGTFCSISGALRHRANRTQLPEGVAGVTCHVSILTAAGRGAIACIAIEGARSTALVARHFQPLRPRPTLDATPVGGVRVGVWGESETGEELVVARVDRGRWEVHCHGGEAAVARIIEDLEAAGAQRREATEWLAERASDELAQSALVLLPHTLTERAAGVLLDQYRGALREALQSVLQHMEA